MSPKLSKNFSLATVPVYILFFVFFIKKRREIKYLREVIYPLILIAIILQYFYFGLFNTGAMFAWSLFYLVPLGAIGAIVLFIIGLVKDLREEEYSKINNKIQQPKQQELDIESKDKRYIRAIITCKVYTIINLIIEILSLIYVTIELKSSPSLWIYLAIKRLVVIILTFTIFIGIQKHNKYATIFSVIPSLISLSIVFIDRIPLIILLMLIHLISAIIVATHSNKPERN